MTDPRVEKLWDEEIRREITGEEKHIAVTRFWHNGEYHEMQFGDMARAIIVLLHKCVDLEARLAAHETQAKGGK